MGAGEGEGVVFARRVGVGVTGVPCCTISQAENSDVSFVVRSVAVAVTCLPTLIPVCDGQEAQVLRPRSLTA